MRALCAGGVICLAVACVRAEPNGETPAVQPLVTFHTESGDIPVKVEIVNDPISRAKGLMYRERLARDCGMVFVFPSEQRQRFWMKNTIIPLDIVFIDTQYLVVGIIANAEPMTETMHAIGVPARFVVEVNAGIAAEYGITEGTRVSMTNVPQTTRR